MLAENKKKQPSEPFKSTQHGIYAGISAFRCNVPRRRNLSRDCLRLMLAVCSVSTKEKHMRLVRLHCHYRYAVFLVGNIFIILKFSPSYSSLYPFTHKKTSGTTSTILSALSTMTHLSWVAPHGMA